MNAHIRRHGPNAMKWIQALTPIIVAMLAMSQSCQAKHSGELTASTVATVVRDQSRDAGKRARLGDRVTVLESRVSKLERPSLTRRADRPEKEPSAVTDRSPGPIEVMGRVAAAPFRWGWSLIKKLGGNQG